MDQGNRDAFSGQISENAGIIAHRKTFQLPLGSGGVIMTKCYFLSSDISFRLALEVLLKALLFWIPPWC